MGPKRGKGAGDGSVEGTVIVIDVGHAMIAGDRPPIDKAKQALLGYLQSNILFKSSALFGLVLYGTQQAANDLEYPNVWELYPLQSPSILALQGVGEVDVGAQEADFLSGLVVALDRLAKANPTGDNRVILITNGLSCVSDSEQVSEIADSMRDMRVKLDVLGVDFDTSAADPTHLQLMEVFERMQGMLGEMYRYLPIETAIEILMQARKQPVTQRSPLLLLFCHFPIFISGPPSPTTLRSRLIWASPSRCTRWCGRRSSPNSLESRLWRPMLWSSASSRTPSCPTPMFRCVQAIEHGSCSCHIFF